MSAVRRSLREELPPVLPDAWDGETEPTLHFTEFGGELLRQPLQIKWNETPDAWPPPRWFAMISHDQAVTFQPLSSEEWHQAVTEMIFSGGDWLWRRVDYNDVTRQAWYVYWDQGKT